MRKTPWVVLLVAVAAAVVIAAVASAATGWRVVRSGSTSGDFAVKSISADINKPKPRGIAIRLKGNVTAGNGVTSCSKDFGVASWARSYKKAGLYVQPMTRGADSCTVVASVGGSGKVTVQILRR